MFQKVELLLAVYFEVSFAFSEPELVINFFCISNELENILLFFAILIESCFDESVLFNFPVFNLDSLDFSLVD